MRRSARGSRGHVASRRPLELPVVDLDRESHHLGPVGLGNVERLEDRHELCSSEVPSARLPVPNSGLANAQALAQLGLRQASQCTVMGEPMSDDFKHVSSLRHHNGGVNTTRVCSAGAPPVTTEPMAQYEDILAAIVAERRRRRWSQAKLAERLNVTQSAVGNWESGRNRISAEQLVEIGRLFDWDLDWVPQAGERREALSQLRRMVL